MTLKKIKHAIPLFVLFALLSLLARELFSANTNNLPSALIGEKLPAFSLPSLYQSNRYLSSKHLRGRVVLLNVWASWCSACQKEHDMLMKISEQYRIPIYGILYKDDANGARNWLKRHGNPYVLVGNDTSGDTAIDLGVYGTPETFVISPQGRIIYRHVGVIDQSDWNKVLYPLIKKYARAR